MVAWSLGLVKPEHRSVVDPATCQPTSSFTAEEPNTPTAGSVVGTQPLVSTLSGNILGEESFFTSATHIQRLMCASKALPHQGANLKDHPFSRASRRSTEISTETVSQLNLSLWVILCLPHYGVGSRALLMNILHVSLHFRYSFLGNPTCDRIWSDHLSRRGTLVDPPPIHTH